jgi:hypothetical protein
MQSTNFALHHQWADDGQDQDNQMVVTKGVSAKEQRILRLLFPWRISADRQSTSHSQPAGGQSHEEGLRTT